jgi:hypothetical protein
MKTGNALFAIEYNAYIQGNVLELQTLCDHGMPLDGLATRFAT